MLSIALNMGMVRREMSLADLTSTSKVQLAGAQADTATVFVVSQLSLQGILYLTSGMVRWIQGLLPACGWQVHRQTQQPSLW